MTKPKLKRVIDYIITVPESEEDPLRAHKYPFVSSEILSAANGALLDLYFSAEDELIEESDQDLALTAKTQNATERSATVTISLKPSKETPSAKRPSTAGTPDSKENLESPFSVAADKSQEQSKPQTDDTVVEQKREEKIEEQPQEPEKELSMAEAKEEQRIEEAPLPSPEESEQDTAAQSMEKCLADIEAACTNCPEKVLTPEEAEAARKFELVRHLFSFISVSDEAELNELLAGYFKRAAIALIAGKPKEMAEFFESNEEVMHNLMRHSHNRSVAEVLCKALSIDDMYLNNPVQFSQLKADILNELVSRLESKSEIQDAFVRDQLGQTFCDLAEQCKEVPTLCCEPKLFTRMLALIQDPSKDVSAAGLRIVTRLLSAERSAVKEYMQKQLADVEPKTEGKLTGPEELLMMINGQLEHFKRALLEGSVFMLAKNVG